MAILCRFSSPPPIQLHQSCKIPSPITKNFMLNHYSQFPLKIKKSCLLRVRSFKNKVFENKSEGIICYIDESGEVICEGFDEGPRLLQQPTRSTYNLRDSEIVNLLHQRLLQIINEGQLKNEEIGVASSVQEDY